MILNHQIGWKLPEVYIDSFAANIKTMMNISAKFKLRVSNVTADTSNISRNTFINIIFNLLKSAAKMWLKT